MYLNYLRYVQQKCFSFPELLQYFLVRFDDNATFRRYEHFCVANLSDISYCLTLPWFMLWIFTTSFLFAPVRALSLSYSFARLLLFAHSSLIQLREFYVIFPPFFIISLYWHTKKKRWKRFFGRFCNRNDVGLFPKHVRIFFSAFSSFQLIFKPLEIVEWKILLLSRWSCRSRHRQRSIAAFA